MQVGGTVLIKSRLLRQMDAPKLHPSFSLREIRDNFRFFLDDYFCGFQDSFCDSKESDRNAARRETVAFPRPTPQGQPRRQGRRSRGPGVEPEGPRQTLERQPRQGARTQQLQAAQEKVSPHNSKTHSKGGYP